MAGRAAKRINTGYKALHKKKPAKGIGVYALAPKGFGPNSVHDSGRGATCACAGCGRKARAAS